MLNFFDPAFQEKPQNNLLFGLCDNEDGSAAYTDTTDRDKWTATVENPNGLTLIFTAIDKGVIKNDKCPGHERCDGMLTSDYHLCFIELKNKKSNWKKKGILQLESTIKLFNCAHPGREKQYLQRKAYICNRKHLYFNENDNEQKLKFFRSCHFRLDIQAKILLAV
jgi:hypothetical protein